MAQAAALKKPAPAEERDQTEDEGEGQPAQPEARRFGGKKIVLFIILPFLVVAMAVVGVFVSGIADGFFGKGKAGTEDARPQKPAVFFDMPELLVNLNTGGRRVNFLKLMVALELDDPADIPKLQILMPRLIDSFQVYLRELRIEDLRGSAGIYRLREDLLSRVNEIAKPVKVRDVLFKEMLVQ